MNCYFDSNPRHHRSPWYGRVTLDGKSRRTPYRATRELVAIDVKILRLAYAMEQAKW